MEYQQKFEPEKIQIIKYGGLLVGRLRVVRKNLRIYIGRLQILPGFQSLGIGSYILQGLIEQSKKQNLPIELEVHKINSRAISFYHKFGFHTFNKAKANNTLWSTNFSIFLCPIPKLSKITTKVF